MTKILTFLDEFLAFGFAHAISIGGIDETIDVRRPRTTDRKFLTHNSSAKGNFVNLTTFIGIPATANQTSEHRILVVVADQTH